MIISGSKKAFAAILCFLTILLSAGFPCLFVAAGEPIAPDRKISLLQPDPRTPKWKTLWDQARSFAEKGDFGRASLAYSELFTVKPNIEEANWEYCKVLMQVKEFATVAKVIKRLLEKDPHRVEFLLVAGEVAMH